MRVSNGLVPGLALALLAATPGCFEEKLAVAVHGDGSGQVELRRRFGANLSALHFLGADDDDARRAKVRDELVEQLACWEGVSAWTDARVEARGDRAEVSARGWFENVNRLRCSEPGVGEHRFGARRTGGVLELEWTFTPPPGARVASLRQARAMTSTLEGLEILGAMVLPGEVTRAEGATRDGARGPEWMLVSMSELAAEIADLEKRIAAGELTGDGAAAMLDATYFSRKATVRCRVRETASELEGFRSEARGARRAYDASPLRKEIEARKRERAAERGEDAIGAAK